MARRHFVSRTPRISHCLLTSDGHCYFSIAFSADHSRAPTSVYIRKAIGEAAARTRDLG